jgi:hypothetical protein
MLAGVDGSATVAGSVRGDLDAGAGDIDGDSSNWDGFLASFDADGELRFADVYGSLGNMDGIRDVAVHLDGNIVVTRYFEGNIFFGGSLLKRHLASVFPDTPIVLRVDADARFCGLVATEKRS